MSSEVPYGDLRGRTVVVTGGNGGIGLALAVGVGRAGAQVAIWGRNAAKNAAAVASLAELGVTSHAVVCDVSEEASVDDAMGATLARFGRVDALFANAGTAGHEAPFVDLTLDDWRAVMRVDVDGVFLTLRAAARHMVERGEGGSLVGVSSIVSRFGAARRANYGAAKPAVEGLLRALAVELAPARIRCNTLSPGWTDTAMTARGGSFGAADYDRFRKATVQRTPVRRWGDADDFHAVAAYLADPTLRFHTGDVVVVDGAYSVY
jgi:NAD(P)-dependent dehydrogenase (short-subunit alcohol dehydrogenase family)